MDESDIEQLLETLADRVCYRSQDAACHTPESAAELDQEIEDIKKLIIDLFKMAMG